MCSRRALSGTRQLAASHPFPRVGFNAAEKTLETVEPDLNNWIGMDGEAAPGGHKSFAGMLISNFFFSRLLKDELCSSGNELSTPLKDPPQIKCLSTTFAYFFKYVLHVFKQGPFADRSFGKTTLADDTKSTV